MIRRILFTSLLVGTLTSCSPPNSETNSERPVNSIQKLSVAQSPTKAMSPNGQYISWKEHLIDAEDVNRGLPIRGGDGLVMADLDQDGFEDIISAHEDSNHLRVAFGSKDPDQWELVTLAEGSDVKAIEDIAIGDLNQDGWLDIIAACEDAHLIYLENPGKSNRLEKWPSLIPDLTTGRGSWLRVFLADVNGDGRLDVTSVNKGAPDLARPEAGDPANGTTSLFTLSGPPLVNESWHEQVLLKDGIPNTAMPAFVTSVARPDILAAARVRQRIFLIQNLGINENGELQTKKHDIRIKHPGKPMKNWKGLSNAFHSDFADINQDGRVDLVVNVVELETPPTAGLMAGLGWLEQPVSLEDPWIYHYIGNTLPDWIIGLKLFDVDGDGDFDVMTGGYSGLNILAGTYSGASRDFDDPSVTIASSVARLAWFENSGDPAGTWTRHDISRRVRGMYDMFVPRDMDGDGDMDIVATRGNSGEYDGVFWLEQIRTTEPKPAFTPARKSESQHLSLPPENWLELYNTTVSYIAPNIEKESEKKPEY